MLLREPSSKRIYTASNLAGLPNLRHTAMVEREALMPFLMINQHPLVADMMEDRDLRH